MNNEIYLGRIRAIMEASEEIINHPKADKDTQNMIKETAYGSILRIIKEWSDAEH